MLVFGTNLFNGGPLLAWGMRSTILSYLGELSLPQSEPYTPTAAWINANVPTGASVWVTPYYAAYPLMFAAPRALYAWQLTWPPRHDFAGLPAIQFAGRVSPDYIIAFGALTAGDRRGRQDRPAAGFRYELAADDPGLLEGHVPARALLAAFRDRHCLRSRIRTACSCFKRSEGSRHDSGRTAEVIP